MPSGLTRRAWLRETGALASLALVAGQREIGDRPGREREIEGVRCCWCPPGVFTMGSPPAEPARRDDEAPVQVTLTHGFWMGKFEVTQGQWRRLATVAADKPATGTFGLGDDVPVYWVTYLAAEAFCRELTVRARRSATITEAWAFRLPTEAQWEYACRAGTTTATAFGDALRLADANFGARYGGPTAPAPSAAPHRPAATRRTPGACATCTATSSSGAATGTTAGCRAAPIPISPTSRACRTATAPYSRVRRGGAWNDPARFCRSALRLRYEPERSSDHIGFRVALVPA